MNKFEKEMRSFFKKDTLIENKVYFGKVMLGKINNDTNVKIYFNSIGVADEYYGFSIEIINKVNGVVDSVYIKFGDILGIVDIGTCKIFHHITDDRYGKISWYSAVPTEKEIDKVMTVISNYISLYK